MHCHSTVGHPTVSHPGGRITGIKIVRPRQPVMPTTTLGLGKKCCGEVVVVVVVVAVLFDVVIFQRHNLEFRWNQANFRNFLTFIY